MTKLNNVGDTYVCAGCGERLKCNMTPEQTLKEAELNYGPGLDLEEFDIVCDDCYRKSLVEDVAAYRANHGITVH